MGQTEQVGTVHEPNLSTEMSQTTLPLRSSDPTVTESEVISSPHLDSSVIISDPPSTEEEDTSIDQDTEQYVRPVRSTRGIPPKRYSPERIGRKSRYSIANFAEANISKMAKDFQTALYEEEIPRTFEEAVKIKHWRDAMLVEMKALKKNGTLGD